jgi:hypothetical protein
MAAPNVIFCSIQNGGGSGVDPILRELLSRKGYFMLPFGPEGTADRFRKELAEGAFQQPFYHWTHDPVETFQGLIGTEAYRFIFLHRDLRDAAVSTAFDYQHRGFAADRSFYEILDMIVTTIVPRQVKEALDWVRSGCMVVTFVQMKQDTRSLISSILTYIDYATPDPALSRAALPADQIDAIVDKHSFETRTGRKRGEDGETLRTNYMFRKGLSGEWKKHFDQALMLKSKRMFGLQLRALGYSNEDDSS